MYPQGVCRIRKPVYTGNGCAIFPAFDAEERAKKIRSPAAGDLFRGSLERYCDLCALAQGGIQGDPGVVELGDVLDDG